MPKKPKHLEAGMNFQSETGASMSVVEITRDAVYVEFERNVQDRDGNWKLEVRKREVPKHLWTFFKRPYKTLVT